MLAASVSAGPQKHNTQKCKKISDKGVHNLFLRWNNALLTLDSEEVADEYWSDATLVPTVSNVVRDDKKSKIEYFDEFLLKKPSGTIVEPHIHVGCNTATYSGLYDFAVSTKDMTTGATVNSVVNARFTFVYEYRWESETWKIIQHHSSKLPNPIGGERKLRAGPETWVPFA